jgi:hypothetical protein
LSENPHMCLLKLMFGKARPFLVNPSEGSSTASINGRHLRRGIV